MEGREGGNSKVNNKILQILDWVASVKSKMVLPFWYQLIWRVPNKGPLNVCVCACVRACVCVCMFWVQYKLKHFEATLLQVIINSSWTDFLVLLKNLRHIAGAVHHEDIVSHLGAKRVEVVQSPLKLHVKVHAVVWRHQNYTNQLMLIFIQNMPSVLWRCWLGSRKGTRPEKKLSGGVMAWLSVWSKVQTFLVLAHLASPGQRAVKRVCVCVCVYTEITITIFRRFNHRFLGKSFGEEWHTFYRPNTIRVTEPTMSQHWKKHKAWIPVSFFLYPLPNSWGKGHCSLHTGSLKSMQMFYTNNYCKQFISKNWHSQIDG